MSCGGDDSIGNDGPDSMDPPGRGGTETSVAPMGPLAEDTAFVRVDMIVTDSTVTMARTNRVTIAKGTQRPQPVMIGNFLLMAKAGNTIVESHLVRHTPAVFSENVDENRNFVDSEINELTQSLSTAFVVADESLTELVVIDRDGDEKTKIDGSALDALLGKSELAIGVSKNALVGRTEAALTVSGYPYVTVLGPGARAAFRRADGRVCRVPELR